MNKDPALGHGLTELIELIAQGDLAVAQRRARTLLERYPQQAELWRLSAICALQQGQLEAAQRDLDRALALEPRSVESWCNLASVYTAGGRLEDAERALRRALSFQPLHAPALNNLGSLLDARGDYLGAADCFAKAIKLKPNYARAWLNQAAALLAVRQLERADSSVRRALSLAPQWGDVHFVLGNVLHQSGRAREALAAYTEAVRLMPDNTRFLLQLAEVQEELGEFAAAAKSCEHILAQNPDHAPTLSQLAFLKRRLCDWTNLAVLSKRLFKALEDGLPGVSPFALLAEESTPAQQLACATIFAEGRRIELAGQIERLRATAHPRVAGVARIGFVAAGFGEHPTTLLIVELIERLRDSGIATLGFATTPDDGGPLRRRLAAAFHEFHDLSAMSREARVRAIRAREIDIAIDLDGYCAGSHPELFAFRLAPLQVNWLAYPGSLGAPHYDYLIADAFVVPAAQRAHYSEAIATLPRCFQPSDTTRIVGEPIERSMCGLPVAGTIFASFNNSWKCNVRSFARWTRILKAVPGSVLWLLSGPSGSPANDNLRRAAQAAGVEPRRLIFAPKLAHADYLTRYRHVGLFLDTNPYNAHTTASDALWAGCPVLTQPGNSFASRVAGSLNQYLGMEALNAPSDSAYVETAVHLAHDPEQLPLIRQRLEQAKQTSSVFDTAGYARDFEAVLLHMFERAQSGIRPADFTLPARTG